MIIILALVTLLCIPIIVSAHAGRTDSAGGHYDTSTGEYHYHHGYPAHQHIDGVCPYNFDEKTGWNSGSSSSGSSYSSNTTSQRTASATSQPENEPLSATDIALIIVYIFFCSTPILFPIFEKVLLPFIEFVYNKTSKHINELHKKLHFFFDKKSTLKNTKQHITIWPLHLHTN